MQLPDQFSWCSCDHSRHLTEILADFETQQVDFSTHTSTVILRLLAQLLKNQLIEIRHNMIASKSLDDVILSHLREPARRVFMAILELQPFVIDKKIGMVEKKIKLSFFAIFEDKIEALGSGVQC